MRDSLLKSSSKLISLIEKLIFESNPYKFLFIAIPYIFISTGFWIAPTAENLYELSKNPYIDILSTERSWLYDNYSLPWIANLVGANSSFIIYIIFSGLILISGLLVFYLFICKFHSVEIAKSFLILYAINPISLVTQGWLGYVDAITLFYGISLAFFLDRKFQISIFTFIMAFTHFSQAIILLLISFLFDYFTNVKKDKRFYIKNFAIYFLILIFGYFFHKFNLNYHQISQEITRVSYIKGNTILTYGFSFFRGSSFIIYSLFCSSWLIIVYWFMSIKNSIAIKTLIIFLIPFSIILVTFDQTRVFSILTFPIILIIIKKWDIFSNLITRKKLITLSLLVSLLLPKIVIWNGWIYGNLFQWNVASIIGKTNLKDPNQAFNKTPLN